MQAYRALRLLQHPGEPLVARLPGHGHPKPSCTAIRAAYGDGREHETRESHEHTSHHDGRKCRRGKGVYPTIRAPHRDAAHKRAGEHQP
jgi:hypothetical protein